MRTSRRAALALISTAAVMASALPASATSAVETRRLAGAHRYATAAAIAEATFPARADGNRRAPEAAVARGDAFPDALAAVNVTGDAGPVLLTPFADLPASTSNALRDLESLGVTIMGQTDVVSTRVEQQIRDMSIGTDRVPGRDRYETAALSYANTGGSGNWNFEGKVPAQVDGLRTAFLASGVQFADAMSAGPVASVELLPLLLTAPDELPASTRDALLYDGGTTREGYGVEQVVVVGGPDAVSERVVRQVEALGITVRRVAGGTRQETAINVFTFAEEEFGWTLGHVNVARGDGFADAVAGGVHAGKEKAPILLTVGVDDLGSVTREFLRSRSATVASIDVLGGPAAVSDAAVNDARNAATSR